MIISFIYVALGSALGAVCRYSLSLVSVKMNFPVMTFITNLLGAFIIGIIAGVVSKKGNTSPNFILFLKTGFCGGFTTFSTFSLEAYNLLSAGAYFTAALYVILSLILCVTGVALGYTLGNR